MAFNVGKFVNQAGKYLSKAREVSNVASELGILKGSNSSGVAKALGRAGNIINDVTSAGSLGVDSYITQRAKSFFGESAGEQIDRTPAAVTPGSESVQNTVAAKSTGPQGLKYPPDLDDYYLSIKFARYERPAPNVKAREEATLFVSLPLPRELKQDHGIDYDVVSLGLAGTVADLLQMNAEEGEDATDGQAAAGAKVVGQSAAGAIAARSKGSLGKLAGLVALGSVSESITTAAGQLTGAVVNPNISVGFRGPQLRQYAYNWEFSPQNAKESADIKKMINEIRSRAMPSMTYTDSTGILSYPQMVTVSTNPDILDFKRSMIQSVNVNYSPNGIPAFFRGTREPVFIGLSISFLEIEYFLSNDFGGANGTGLNRDLEEIFTSIKDQLTSAGGE